MCTFRGGRRAVGLTVEADLGIGLGDLAPLRDGFGELT